MKLWAPVLLLLGLLAVLAWPQPYEPLGKLHCRSEAIWVHVLAHFEGYRTERGIDVWMCREDYEEMTSE